MSRANREHTHTLERMGGFVNAFGAGTLLGAWLRQQPVVLKAGKNLAGGEDWRTVGRFFARSRALSHLSYPY